MIAKKKEILVGSLKICRLPKNQNIALEFIKIGSNAFSSNLGGGGNNH